MNFLLVIESPVTLSLLSVSHSSLQLSITVTPPANVGISFALKALLMHLQTGRCRGIFYNIF